MLGKRPMTAREISREMRLNRNSVYIHLHNLRDQNLIVKRSDKKWVPIVKLVAQQPGVPESSKKIEQSPEIKVPEPRKKEYSKKIPDWVSPQAKKVALHFRVPAVIHGKEVGIGKVELCDQCKKPSPLKYGGVTICPLCARR